MSSHRPDEPRQLSRRTALKVIAGTAGAAVSLPILNNAQPATQPASQAPTALFFDAEEMQTLDALSETIIPADNHSPGAREARVSAYIDAIVADSGAKRKDFWKRGLAAMNRRAEKEFGRKYAACTSEQQAALLQKLSENEEQPKALEERFFVAMKRAAIEGYYTSPIGIHKELEYQGNTALAGFPGCAHTEHGKE